MSNRLSKIILSSNETEDEAPLRSEILSKELLGLHAKEMAKFHTPTDYNIPSVALKSRFKSNCKVLNTAYFSLSEINSNKGYLAAGAEWLLDNYHVIEEQVREIRRDLPSSYYKALPKISSSRWKGFPRVYRLACDYLEHTDAIIQLETLSEYISSYQEHHVLKTSELWAIPIMLRLALVENLRRLSQSVLRSSLERDRTEKLFLKIAEGSHDSATKLLNQLILSVSTEESEFETIVPTLIGRLRSLGSTSSLGVQWLEEKLKEKSINLSERTRRQQQFQASDQISIGNSITSLKNIGRLNWREWVESVSFVTLVLEKEDTGVFKSSDFLTRDHIRHRVEVVARRTKSSEVSVAEQAILLAKKERETHKKESKEFSFLSEFGLPEHHAAYFLIDEGLPILEDSLNAKTPAGIKLLRSIKRNISQLYISLILLLTLCISASLAWCSFSLEKSTLLALLIFFFSFIPAIQLSSELIQWISSKLIKPKALPKLDFEKSIPDSQRTAIVVQTILTNRDHLKKTIEDLEIRAIGNASPNVQFGILADLPDSDHEETSGDRGLIANGIQLIKNLNEHYKEQNLKFFILFRHRQFNAAENCFMGWERKRGKLIEFNRLIRGADNTSFSEMEADLSWLREAVYVITLDNDTQLPRGVAHKLIGCAAHPLNYPIKDNASERITRGYSIIQPRVGITLESASASLFSRLFSGQSGLDPYTRAVSDLYQDLFKEASYIGKGIYHVDAFESSIQGKIPENSVLSHDLLESGFARCGLASDIEVFDDFPMRYHANAKRQHRWIRGDWQLLPWIFSLVPTAQGKAKTNFSSIVRWKLFDNLRRSLLPLSSFTLLLTFLTIAKTPVLWITVFFFLTGFRVYSLLYSLILEIPIGYSLGTHFSSILRDIKKNVFAWIFDLSVLPHQAILALDASLRTVYRVYFSKKHLLEWETALTSEQRMKASLLSFLSSMSRSYILIGTAIVLFYFISVQSILCTSAFITLWVIAPLLAWECSKSFVNIHSNLRETDKNYLSKIAYDTWKYFRNHLTEEFNYLIPDNIQLIPQPVVAERTSPTNISLSLLSLVSAYDMGFIPSTTLFSKTSKILGTIEKLERYQGHLLNWYSIRDLRPLLPRYVSSVDSGNFVGHLIVQKQAIKELPYIGFITQNHLNFLSANLSGHFGIHKNLTFHDFYTKVLPGFTQATEEERKNASDNYAECKEVVDDLYSLTPYVEWVSKLSILEELSRHDLIPKKLERVNEILKNRALSPSLALKIATRLINSKDKIDHTKLSSKDLNDFMSLVSSLESGREAILNLIEQSTQIVSNIESLVENTKFSFLFDESKKLLSIGYNIDNATLDNGSYDLLASEARLASFMGIAKGELPQSHWFLLGRALTETAGGKALISWSGTMFEYLMPQIVMKNHPSTLLGRTCEAVVKAQQNYSARRGVPWGISESAYDIVDFENTYQYRAFGVPGLGLKRGLVEDLVISPYSSALALQIDTEESIKNLHALETIGVRGEYGFYESVDYTPSRLSTDESYHIIKSFFAHHQGMSLAAINNVLNGCPLQERFHKDLRVQSCELLLHERFPSRIPLILPHQAEQLLIESIPSEGRGANREHFHNPHQPFPRTHILSNGNYTLCVDHTGSGFSSLNDIQLNRFNADNLINSYGQYVYIRDEVSSSYWSNTYRPTFVEPESFEAIFSPDKAEFQRRDFEINSHTEIVISPEDNIEIRKVALTNHSSISRKLSLTSFMEISLAEAKADAAHPAFSKIFIETEWISELEAIFCKRKPRSSGERTPLLFHFVAAEVVWAPTQFTTDRYEFIGRGRNPSSPQAITSGHSLKGKTGFVLDPCASVRQTIELEPGESTNVYFVSGISEDIEEAHYLCKKYRDTHSIKRAFELAWSHANVEQKNQQFSKSATIDFQHLANALLYNVPEVREHVDAPSPNLPQKALWRLGISGDEPIAVLTIDENQQIPLFQEVLLSHEYLRTRGIRFDLVVLNQKSGGYLQELHEELEGIVAASFSGALLNQKGGIFIRDIHHLSPEEIQLLRSTAHVLLDGAKGALNTQLNFKKTKSTSRYAPITMKAKVERKPFSNNPTPTIGTFIENGRAYQINVNHNSLPPLPWSNVIANSETGVLITETGAGYSWIGNSRENRTTHWSNDPISDPHSEAFFIRDCETSDYWCPTVLPVPTDGSVIVTHKPGITTFERNSFGIKTVLEGFVSEKDCHRFWTLSIENTGEKQRTLELIFYIDWVLGVSRKDSFRHIHTGVDSNSGFLYAKNHWNQEFGDKILFVGATLPLQDYTTDKKNFLGVGPGLGQPTFLELLKKDEKKRKLKTRPMVGSTLSRKTGFGFESSGILKYEIELPPFEKTSVGFYISNATSLDEAKNLSKSLRILSVQEEEKRKTTQKWEDLLSRVQIETPDKEFNYLINTWLPYQTLSCRMYARTGFYQSSGAFGFRDQLQDSLAFLYTSPEITRRQILINCSRQFEEGDVQHWWHPPSGRGIRSRISDNYLWLPFALLEYLEATGDKGLLEENVSYLKGPLIEEGQHDLYFEPEVSSLNESVYEHCLKALDRSFPVGPQGLPLIGTGDWNDGMNQVGPKGKGESVWLAWFLASILKRFSLLCEERGDSSRVDSYRKHSTSILESIESHSWDGKWYHRAYFDDGTPIGSSKREECRIDSLAQSWSVITGLGNPERRKIAVQSAYNELFDKQNQLVRLLWPPFQRSEPNAGYIQSYPPGIRENGGQYTHGSSWLIAAMALDGFNNQAMELFRAMNPVTHTDTLEKANTYMTEPYVTCGDVYSHSQHAGRGGWSWYTGSSAWLYQIGIRYLLGLSISEAGIKITPRVPDSWKTYTINAKLKNINLEIIVSPKEDEASIHINGRKSDSDLIPWESLTEDYNKILIKSL